MSVKPSGGRNVALTRLLSEVGWSVARLAHEVNREMGEGYVSRTTVSEWLNWSRIPRQPLPTVVAHVLSQAKGAPVPVPCLWPGVAVSRECVAADEGMRVPWDLQGTRAVVSRWLAMGGDVFDSDRRVFMAVSGAALTAPALQYVDQIGNVPQSTAFDKVLGASGFSEKRVSLPLVEYFGSVIGAFRHMDDVEGGSSENLKYLRHTIGQLTEYLHNGKFIAPGLGQALLRRLAELSQIAGWMAFDAERPGLAQRYYQTGLHAAQNVGDRDLGAHILGCMAYQAATRGQLRESEELAEAAIKAGARAHPLTRTVVSCRAAHVKAATGDGYGYRVLTEQAAQLFEESMAAGGGPEYLYWFDATMADTVAGQSILELTLKSPRNSRAQLAEAERLLVDEIAQTGQDRPRDAAYHGAWLARAHIKRGDLHRSLEVAESALNCMGAVSSPRTVKVLRDYGRDLANLRGNRNLPEVRTLRRKLQPALAEA